MGSWKSGRRGWGNYEDLSGRRFGRWTVQYRAEDNEWGQAMWFCVCDCGYKARTQGKVLRSGRSRSCGCLKSEMVSERMKRQWRDGTFARAGQRRNRQRKTNEVWQ